MKIILTDHAKMRIQERHLTIKEIRTFVTNPDSVDPSKKNPNRFLIKKLYHHRLLKKPHLLMAICEQEKERLVIITIIDTSKVRKYS